MTLPGMELSVLFPLPWYVELTGALQMGSSGSFRTDFTADPSFRDFLYPLRLSQFFDLSDDWAMQLGLNAVFGPSQTGADVGNRSYAYGADLMFKWRPSDRAGTVIASSHGSLKGGFGRWRCRTICGVTSVGTVI